LSRLLSRRTAIHTTTGTSKVINKITATADSYQAFDPETCLPSVSDDTFALNLTRTAMPPYHPGSGITRLHEAAHPAMPSLTMPMPDMPDIASAG
jgi:hypothetical protein